MIFENLVNSFLSTFCEQNEQTIAFIPGSFKPPHKGHYAMIKHFSDIANKVIVIISDPQSEKSIRRTQGGKKITSTEAKQILDIYSKSLSNIEFIISTSPVKWVYDYVGAIDTNTENIKRILLGVSGKGEDAKRYLGAQKYAPEGVTLEPSIFNSSELNVSATNFREVIDNPTIDNISPFLPPHLSSQDKQEVLEILSQLEEEYFPE